MEKTSRGSFRAEKINKKVYSEIGTALDLLEIVLSKLLSCCKVSIMPGIFEILKKQKR